MFAQEPDSTKYYRQLIYNHVSPQMPIRGIHEISEPEAEKSPHYIFRYNTKKQLSEIINNNPEAWKSHPLTHIGVYRISFEYANNKEIRTFYDKFNKQVTNIRGVYKEVHSFDSAGFKSALDFYDIEDKPMASNWMISRYTWEKKNDLVVERRYNLNGEKVMLSSYFEFLITGIKYNDEQLPMACYNLNETLEIVNNLQGIASYRDKYDQFGNHIEYAYYNSNNELCSSPSGFAIGKKYYDGLGNVIKCEYLSKYGNILRREYFRYDTNGYLTE